MPVEIFILSFLLWSVFQLKSQVTAPKFDLAPWVQKIQNNSTKEQNSQALSGVFQHTLVPVVPFPFTFSI